MQRFYVIIFHPLFSLQELRRLPEYEGSMLEVIMDIVSETPKHQRTYRIEK